MKKYKNIEIDHETNPWATHQPALIWAVEQTNKTYGEIWFPVSYQHILFLKNMISKI